MSGGRSLLQNPTPFPPLCNCDRNPLHSPYRLAYGSSSSSAAVNVMCYTVTLYACDPKWKCCRGQDLHKAEFDVSE